MAPPKAGLVVTTMQSLPFSVIASFQAQYNLGDALQVVTQAGHLGVLEAAPSSLSVILSISDAPGHHNEALLAELSRVLQPGGVLQLQEPVSRRKASHDEAQKLGPLLSNLQSQSDVERRLLLAGFSAKESIPVLPEGGLAQQWSGITPASVGSIQGPLLQPFAVKVEKPQWSTGTSFALKKKTPKPVSSASPNTTAASPIRLAASGLDDVTRPPATSAVPSSSGQGSVWKMDMGDDDGELVDEDALLTEEDMVRPTLPNNPVGDDCGSSGRKACKNCTCGRAEMEADPKSTVKAVLTSDLLDNPQSACGSCGLGDAFRCAGCPYKGLPAFKLGEKISLPNSFLTADA